MNLNKHLAVYFFESAINNIIVNLGITGLFFLLVQENPGVYLIPLLLLFNTVWFTLYIFVTYLENNGLVISQKGKALLLQLISFYILNCLFWVPGTSRKFFLVSNSIFGLSVLLAYILRAPLKKTISARLSKEKNTESPDFGIIGKLKGYLGNGFSGKNYQPSFSVSGDKKVNAITYNLKGDFPQISRVSLNAEMQTQEHLENAEYTFGNINFGDTLAEDWLVSSPYNYRLNIPLKQLNNRILKRGFDLFASVFIIVFFLSWMVPIIGLLIKLESKGPVFFRQLRSGRNNKPFWCYKFRSMYVNEQSDKLQATKGDNRITAIGAFLRKTSIDEFPQFINIFKGEMSIVGPRPHMLMHTEFYGAKIENYMKRLAMKQGLTGWAQVNGHRGETTDIQYMEERVRHDLWYMENWSLWLDIKIVLLTAIKVFKTDTTAF
jgi:lipopolysaccharide/colanic/teichoic acid biosynthesis glycosyltransferase